MAPVRPFFGSTFTCKTLRKGGTWTLWVPYGPKRHCHSLPSQHVARNPKKNLRTFRSEKLYSRVTVVTFVVRWGTFPWILLHRPFTSPRAALLPTPPAGRSFRLRLGCELAVRPTRGGLSEGLGRGDVLAPHRSARERAGAEDARSAERAARGFWGVLCSFWSQQLGLCLDSHRCHALRPRVTLSTQCLGPPRTTAHRKSGVRSKTPAGRSQASAALSILCESDRGKSILAQTLVVAWMAEGGRGRPEKMTSHKRVHSMPGEGILSLIR